ncbi:SIR2 family protein [uncultured Nocardioides sp.]|uniref:SIR2 family protein n=1 Tax=uncultured Nocardioides sp. TaxID=198441 RepID=UPI002618453A|nr:SIR2 family protein [uncultured Nocardioides sp.]
MPIDVIDLGTFVRQWAVQSPKVGWLLGAGASAAARVPTADHIMMDLLLRLYADAHQVVRQSLSLSEARDVERIREYYDGRNGMPALDDPASYSVAFQLALPDPGARRQHLRSVLEGRSPSYGQRILGAFVAAGLTDLVLTTNFDDLIERAVEQAQVALDDPSRRRMLVADLGNPGQANLALSDDDFPFLFKLHGDFRDRELKNLESELQAQDANMRHAVLDASRRFGVAVIGYSGRDASVMEMLTEAVRTEGAFPAGLWWMGRRATSMLNSVKHLFDECAANGVSAYYVLIETFDETMAALGRQAELPDSLRSYVDNLQARPRVTNGGLPQRDRGSLPALRMNALPVLDAPTRAIRAILTATPDRAETREALHEASWRGAAVTSGRQVLALGSPGVLRKALAIEGRIEQCDIDPLAETATTIERALVYEALARGLARGLPVQARIRDSGHRLIVNTTRNDAPESERKGPARALLARAYGDPLTGQCPANLGRGADGRPRRFAESVELALEWRLGALWLLFIPRTWVSALPPADRQRGSGDPASAWRKERWVDRRNEKWAAIIDAWAKVLAPVERTEVSVLPSGLTDRDLVGGRFILGKTTAYSREAQ